MTTKLLAFLKTLPQRLAEARKALSSAAAVLVTIQATVGVPTNVKAVVAQVLAVLAAGGVTWKISNAPAPKPSQAGLSQIVVIFLVVIAALFVWVVFLAPHVHS